MVVIEQTPCMCAGISVRNVRPHNARARTCLKSPRRRGSWGHWDRRRAVGEGSPADLSVSAGFFRGKKPHSRRQLFAKAVIAASRVTAYPSPRTRIGFGFPARAAKLEYLILNQYA